MAFSELSEDCDMTNNLVTSSAMSFDHENSSQLGGHSTLDLFFDDQTSASNAGESSKHPALQKVMQEMNKNKKEKGIFNDTRST